MDEYKAFFDELVAFGMQHQNEPMTFEFNTGDIFPWLNFDDGEDMHSIPVPTVLGKIKWNK